MRQQVYLITKGRDKVVAEDITTADNYIRDVSGNGTVPSDYTITPVTFIPKKGTN